MTPRLIEEGTLRMLVERNLVVAAWREAPTVAQLRALERAGRSLEDQLPGKNVLLNLMISGTPNFSAEVREEAIRLSGVPDIFSLAAAHVILAQGLVGTAVRAFLSTVVLLSKPPTPTKIFGDKTPATTWLMEHLKASGEPWSRDQILSLARQV